MNLLVKLLTLPVSGPVECAWWAAQKIAERAEEVFYDDAPVRSALLELELRLDLGEIDEEAFEAEEMLLLEHLREIREYKFQRVDSSPSD